MIYCIPLGDKNIASSRLRVHLIAPYLGYSFDLPDQYKKGDILIIQKAHKIDELKKAKSQGVKCIFDIDDPYLHHRTYAGMAEIADLVTVDSNLRAEYVRKYTEKPIMIIPNALDWDGITRKEDVRNGIAGWTSYGNNAGLLEGINIPFKLRLITTPDAKEYFHQPFEQIDWSLETVDEEIRKCEIMICHLPLNEITKQKSMHKLLKSWANGVPCYTSRVPDYIKAMQEAGVGERYLVDDDKWKTLVNYAGFDDRCFDYAMRYKAEEVSKLWKQAYESL